MSQRKVNILSAGAAALVLIGAPVANADTVPCSAYNPCQRPGTPKRFYSGFELNYLVDLDSQHIEYSDAPQAVDTGHMVCKIDHAELNNAHLAEAAAVVTAHWPGTLPDGQANWVVIAAWAHICA
jgi:hypothetical protein